jgi:cullin 1
MADGDVRRVLLSLLRPKILILSRGPTKVSSSDTTDGIGECSNPSPANPSWSTVEARNAAAAALLESLADTAVVSLNTNFSSKALMVKLSTLLAQNSAVDAANEDCEAHKTICEDRRILIQASIVRIMKSKKQLSHAGLMCEVLSQLEGRFQVVVADIKRNIDVMIEKEYIERADALDVYRYV